MSAIFILIPVLFEAEAANYLGSVTAGFKATVGSGQVIIWDNTTCKQITNSSAKDYFIPTKTQTEWNNFVAHLPANVTVASCVSPCSSGYYGDGVTCTIAPLGSYANGLVATQCAAGRYGSTTGNTTNQCNGACQAGYYCPLGTWYQNSNICPAGTWSDTGAASCTNCGVNTYNPTAGGTSISSCQACPYGQTSGTGASFCTAASCTGGTTSGYTYGSINWGSSQSGITKSVTNGTCSATATCTAGSIGIGSEFISACTNGYFDKNASCADGCESRCGDGICNNGETTGTCAADCGCVPGATQTMYCASTSACGVYAYSSELQTCQANFLFSPSTCSLPSQPVIATNTGYAAQTSSCGTYGYTSGLRNCLASGSFDTATYPLNSAPALTADRTKWLAATVACGSTCTSQNQVCGASGWSGTYTNASCSVDTCQCIGGTTSGYTYLAINYGSSQPGLTKNVTPSPSTCTATASCNAGTVTIGSESASCKSGYWNANGNCSDGCESQCGDLVCNNGETQATCPGDCGCTPGTKRTQYASGSNGCGTYCLSEEQTCQANYAFNGTYTLSSCTASQRTAYSPTTSSCGTYSYSSEGQTCGSGGWSGTYSLTSPPLTSTRTAYSALTSSCGTYSYSSEGQTCGSGGWSGTYTLGSAPSADTRTAYSALTSGCGTYGSNSEGQTCGSGGWSGTYTLTSPPAVASRTAYSALTSGCGTYGSNSQGQTCGAGGWSGTYTLTSAPAASTRTAYSALTNGCGTYGYNSEGQTCGAGGWSGTYTLGSAPSADTRTAYSALTSGCGTYGSNSQGQTCGSGGWSGTYTLGSAPAASTRTAYSALTSGCGTYGSNSEGQTCGAGGWSGTYTLGSAPAASTRTAYSALTNGCGTYGSNSEGQTCGAGGWSGTYTLGSAPAASTRTGYTSSSVACGGSCTTQGQTCGAGGWSGTGIGSCSVDPCACTSWTYSGWGSCSGGSKSRTVATALPPGCSGGSPDLTAACPCESWTYSGWSSCNASGQQTRTITSSSPAGCSGGSPDSLTDSTNCCVYAFQCGTDHSSNSPVCAGSYPAKVLDSYVRYSCDYNSCVTNFDQITLDTCSMPGQCQTGGGCSNATCLPVTSTGAGVACGSFQHYVCDGYGGCSAPTYPITGGSGACSGRCSKGCAGAAAICYESGIVSHSITCSASSYPCNLAGISCTCYSY